MGQFLFDIGQTNYMYLFNKTQIYNVILIARRL